MNHRRTNPMPRAAGIARRAAFTLVEMVLAMAITVIIGGVVAVMVKSTTMGAATQADGRRQLVRVQALESQLASTLHCARAFLAADGTPLSTPGSGYLVFWRGDTSAKNGINQAVDDSEICLLEFDAVNHQLKLYTFPPTYSGADQTWALTSSITPNTHTYWYNNAQSEKSNPSFTATVLANHVTSFNAYPDNYPNSAWNALHCTLQVVLDSSVASPNSPAVTAYAAGSSVTAVFGVSIRSVVVPQ